MQPNALRLEAMSDPHVNDFNQMVLGFSTDSDLHVLTGLGMALCVLGIFRVEGDTEREPEASWRFGEWRDEGMWTDNTCNGHD